MMSKGKKKKDESNFKTRDGNEKEKKEREGRIVMKWRRVKENWEKRKIKNKNKKNKQKKEKKEKKVKEKKL